MCVVVAHYENGEKKSRTALRDQIFVKLNENATESYEYLKWAYGEHVVLRAEICRWHKAFLDVADEPLSGRPCISKTDENVTKAGLP